MQLKEIGDIPGLLELSMDADEVEGKISNQMSQGQFLNLSDISLDGNKLSFSHDCQQPSIEL